jgi:hypothetical protein
MKWQYIVITVPLDATAPLLPVEKTMNEMGAQGWEVFAIVAEPVPVLNFDIGRRKITLFSKRPLNVETP